MASQTVQHVNLLSEVCGCTLFSIDSAVTQFIVVEVNRNLRNRGWISDYFCAFAWVTVILPLFSMNCLATRYVNTHLVERPSPKRSEDFTDIEGPKKIAILRNGDLAIEYNHASQNTRAVNCGYPQNGQELLPIQGSMELSEFLRAYEYPLEKKEQTIFFRSGGQKTKNLSSITITELTWRVSYSSVETHKAMPVFINADIEYSPLRELPVRKVYLQTVFNEIYFAYDRLHYVTSRLEKSQGPGNLSYVTLTRGHVSRLLHKKWGGHYESGYKNSQVAEEPLDQSPYSKDLVELKMQDQPPDLQILSYPTNKGKSLVRYGLRLPAAVSDRLNFNETGCYLSSPKVWYGGFYIPLYLITIPVDTVLSPVYAIILIKDFKLPPG